MSLFFHHKPMTAVDTAVIEGFDIPIPPENADRIHSLVDHYEKDIISHVDQEYLRTTTWADRLADQIAAFGGSWSFIVIFAVVLIVWITWNSLALTRTYRFDPAPYILLNLCLSFIAAFQAPIIMMSQNRQAARDKRESIIDFAINYRAGQEVADMQGHLHRIEDKLEQLERLVTQLAQQREKT